MTTDAPQFTKPSPRAADPDLTQPFWEATKRNELVIPYCKQCGEHFWYPRAACPGCLSENWEWSRVSGNGRLHAYTVVRQPGNPAFNDDVPYVNALVQLDEGVKIFSNLVDVDVDGGGFEIDMRLQAVFEPIDDDWTLVKFKPA
jgi:uncharacterized OB-fold protein